MKKDPQKIIFEQPLNESIRICLRLEHLFNQIDQNMDPKFFHSNLQLALMSLVRMLEVIDRPDIKSKLTQTLMQQATTLAQLERMPQVNSDRLSQTLLQLEVLIDQLHNTNGKIATHLRSNEFLNQIRLQIASPGGAVFYNSPALHLWLYQPEEECIHQLQQWLADTTVLKDTASLILNLTRESTTAQSLIAPSGFHHQTLNPSLPCQMVRIILSKKNIFPLVSAGKHRINIRFLTPNYIEGGHVQLQEDLEFELACCRL